MTDVVLPTAIQAFVDATNRGDSDAFLEAFGEDPTLEDWGRVFTGRDGVAAWDRSDNIGKHSRFEVLGVERAGEQDVYVVTVRVTGGGYNGTSPLTFRLRDDRIDRLTIAPS